MTNLVEFPPAWGSLSERVAEEVRALMARRRVKQADLAAVLNVKQPQVSQRLNGHIDFTIAELDALARFFNVSPASLLGFAAPVSPPPDGVPAGGDDLRARRYSKPQPSDPKVLPFRSMAA